MSVTKRLLAVLAVGLVSGIAVAQALVLNPPSPHRVEFTNCVSGGSSAQLVYRGAYLLRVKDEGAWLCFDSTCVSGGEWFPANTIMLIRPLSLASPLKQLNVSCRGTGTADIILTRSE